MRTLYEWLESTKNGKRKKVVLSKILEKNALVLDIGSHNGEFLQIVYRDDLAVHSFEPQLDCLTLQKTKFRKKKNITYHNLAVSEKTGVAEFYVSVGTDGSSLNRPLDHLKSQWATTQKRIEVRTSTLEEIIAIQNFSKIDLIKCDTQGSDLKVMESMGTYFRTDFLGAALIEISVHAFYENQSSFAEIVAAFEKRDYFLAEIFPVLNSKKWLWYFDALFLPRIEKYVT